MNPRHCFLENEVKCSAFDVEMIFHSHANKTHFTELRKVVHLASLRNGEGFWNY